MVTSETNFTLDIYFKHEGDGVFFLDYINSQLSNIHFTIENEVDGRVSFLDMNIDRSQGIKPPTSIFRKTTFTGMMMSFLSSNQPFFFQTCSCQKIDGNTLLLIWINLNTFLPVTCSHLIS